MQAVFVIDETIIRAVFQYYFTLFTHFSDKTKNPIISVANQKL